MILNFLKWYKRNFGYVYVQADYWPEVMWRFRARRGRIALCWNTVAGTIPFVCRLSPDGKVLIDEPSRAGYGKQYGDWTWRYFYPVGFPLENIKPGGFWK